MNRRTKDCIEGVCVCVCSMATDRMPQPLCAETTDRTTSMGLVVCSASAECPAQTRSGDRPPRCDVRRTPSQEARPLTVERASRSEPT